MLGLRRCVWDMIYDVLLDTVASRKSCDEDARSSKQPSSNRRSAEVTRSRFGCKISDIPAFVLRQHVPVPSSCKCMHGGSHL